MAEFGTSKKKRARVGRPTNLESIFKNIDKRLIDTMDLASKDLPVAYQTIRDAMCAKESSQTNKLSAAKWIIDFNQKAFADLYEQLMQEVEDQNKEIETEEPVISPVVMAPVEEEEEEFTLNFEWKNPTAPSSNSVN